MKRNKILLNFLLMNIFFIYINCLVEFIPVMDEDFQSCMPDKKYHRVDLENFKLVTGKDRVYANGTVKFLKDIQSPWKIDISTERMVNGVWQDGDLKKTISDFCLEKKNPTDPMSTVAKHIPDCPIKAGQTKEFNMVPTSPGPAWIPNEYRGEWRLYSRTTYSDSENGEVEDCSVIPFEVMQP